MSIAPRHGDLRIWWIPQVPGTPFIVHVASLVEARLLLDALADYDRFQFEQRVKPDYCNAGGLMAFDAYDDTEADGSWHDWHDTDGDDIDAFTLETLRECCPVWEGSEGP